MSQKSGGAMAPLVPPPPPPPPNSTAYGAFTHGLIGRWVYLMRTVPDISSLLKPLEDAIRIQLLPSISGHPGCSADEWDLLSLPCHFCGLGHINPMKVSDSQFDASLLITASLKDPIIKQSVCAQPPDVRFVKAQVHLNRRRASKEFAMHVRGRLSSQLQRAVDLNSEPGASSWLLALPLQEQGFHLNKQEFWDAVHLRYRWKLLNVPSHCVCGASFTIDHAMVCQHGGLTFVQHNDLRDIMAGLLSRVCSDVATEPPLQPLSGEVITPKSAN